ncbi:hypothetical protein CASFOL_036036 [Castilleja foliolosa]|uniref:Protein kinase domain-containing protein n=1 Tax=Castilleja foliolosa TaxID=1961234 RepID=A0ABD3BV85_9LAMI
MNFTTNCVNSIYFYLLLLITPSFSLNLDGTLLLSFKYSILSDPLSVLDNWDYNDETPCRWTGVTCSNVQNTLQVTTLSLPNSKLLGIITQDLGFIPHLQTLDLSNNIFNGHLPKSLFNHSELQILSLSRNTISGVIPEPVSGSGLKLLNLSGNALTGSIPIKIQSFEFLDLSSNSLNGSLPLELDGENLKYLNLSKNKLSGLIPLEFALKIPGNATIDLSFNDFSGQIPDLLSLTNQKTESFEGNVGLCGKPLKKLCVIPSTLSTPENLNTNTSSSPAIAVIPKTINSNNNNNNPFQDSSRTTQNAAQNNRISTQHVLKPGAVAGIVIIPLAGIGVFAAMIALYIHQRKKKSSNDDVSKEFSCSAFNTYAFEFKKHSGPSSSMVIQESRNRNLMTWACLSIKNGDDNSEPSTGSDSDQENGKNNVTPNKNHPNDEKIKNNVRLLVMVDGETELELETLFKASAYVLGSSGPSIIYKAVLHDGTAFAVRRIGDGVHNRMKEFESQVRAIAKMRHMNLVRVWGFVWGDDEKLVIYDYVSNGSLANIGYRKMGSSPYHLPFETRLKIAKGVARGLTYIHDKKNVHGNIKPSNILLTLDMEPIISDFGLHWLIHGKNNIRKSDGPARHFGSKRSSSSPHDDFIGCTSAYHAPESLDSLKPSPKWDVYSFGILLLELLTGKVFSDRELSQWAVGSVVEDPTRVLRMADVAIRGDMAGRDEALLAWFKLGFSCASLVPQKRPCMKDALHVLEKIPCWSN